MFCFGFGAFLFVKYEHEYKRVEKEQYKGDIKKKDNYIRHHF